MNMGECYVIGRFYRTQGQSQARFTFIFRGEEAKARSCTPRCAVSRANGTFGMFAAERAPKTSPLKIHSLPPSPILLHFLLTHSRCIFYTHHYFSLYLHTYAHVSSPYITTPFSFVLVYILYTAYFNADAVYVCIHCMPVCVSIV